MRSWPQTETAGSSADGADESCPTEGEIGTVVLDLRPLFHFNPLTLKGVDLPESLGCFFAYICAKPAKTSFIRWAIHQSIGVSQNCQAIREQAHRKPAPLDAALPAPDTLQNVQRRA